MRRKLLNETEQAVRKNRHRRIWQKAVSCLACIVVFCTTYVLILPAITMEASTSCELEEHVHTEECYVQVTSRQVTSLACGYESLGVHTHDESCPDDFCGYADFLVHQHDASCRDESGALVCTLPEVKAHEHTDECYAPAEVHVHDDSCYTTQRGELTCTRSDTEAHTHTESCYAVSEEPVCGLEETAGHKHDETCAQTELICTLSTQAAHVHGEDCYEQELTCTLSEEDHEHGEECYTGKLICELSDEAHVHTDECWKTTGTCTLPEEEGHTHSAKCYQSLTCTIPEGLHQHTDSCYAQISVLSCPFAQGTETPEPELICTKEEIILHTHEEDCFETYTENGEEKQRLICTQREVLEHQHEESCFVTEEIPVDTEALTCTLEETEGHTHSEECYDEAGQLTCTLDEAAGHTHNSLCRGTWELVCTRQEHTHTAECMPILALTEEERAQIDKVIAMIDAMPSADEIDAKLAEFEANEDAEGEEAYLTETYAAVIETYKAYAALGETAQSYVTNSMKLLELEYIWSAAMMDDTNKGTIPESMGDRCAAYISELTSTCKSGTMTLDETEGRGNDVSYDDDILRTYDVAVYNLNYSIALRNDVLNDNIGGYVQGWLYFEFVLPLSEEQARFETASMDWLGTQMKDQLESHLITGKRAVKGQDDAVTYQDVQVFYGRVLLKGTAEKPGIANGEGTITVAIRALNMKNGQTIQPEFTLWLENNETGSCNYNNLENLILVSDNTEVCDKSDEEADTAAKDTGSGTDTGEESGKIPHGREPKTVREPELEISAAPRYNVRVELGTESINSKQSTFDFSTGDADAPNKNVGTYYGKMAGFGLVLEIRDENGKGLVGVELPDGTETFKFTVDLSTSMKASELQSVLDMTSTEAMKADADYQAYVKQFGEDELNAYRPLVWSAAENFRESYYQHIKESSIPYNRAIIHTDPNYQYYDGVTAMVDAVVTVPFNRTAEGVTVFDYNSCHDGGKWKFTFDAEKPESVQVEVSGISVDPADFPYTYGRANRGTYTYYDETVVGENYWLIKQGVFSAGELWVVYPYASVGMDSGDPNYLPDIRETFVNGTMELKAEAKNLEVWYGDETTPRYSEEEDPSVDVVQTDDKKSLSGNYDKPGSLDTEIWYVKGENENTSGKTQALTEGGTYHQQDWAMQGQALGIMIQLYQDGAEGLLRGTGADILLKFDDRFFDPNGSAFTYFETDKILWAAKPDGSGWDHNKLAVNENGYDAEMMQADAEDLIYCESLEELEEDGKTCVGALLQVRRAFNVSTNHLFIYVYGTVKEDCPTGYVAMTAFSSHMWRMSDVADIVRAENGLDANKIPDDELFTKFARTYLPDWSKQTSAAYGSDQKVTIGFAYNGETRYPGYRESYDATTGSGSNGANGHGTSTKAKYTTPGTDSYGYGEYVSGSAGGHIDFIDSCLVVPYYTSITKTTAQTIDEQGTQKVVYDVAAGQNIVDYKLSASATRKAGAMSASEGAGVLTDIYIEDAIPAGQIFYETSVYWTGTEKSSDFSYTQDPGWSNVGTLTGCMQPSTEAPEGNPTGEWIEGSFDPTKQNEDGSLPVTFILHNVRVDGNNTTTFGEIYYSCEIESGAVNGQTFTNVANIWSHDKKVGEDGTVTPLASGDYFREFSAVNGNQDDWTIRVTRGKAISISKLSDQLIADWWDNIGYTMTASNDSGNDEEQIIVESLPFNGKNNTSFTGQLQVTEFSAGTFSADTNKALMDKFTFYYTTREEYAGCRSSNLNAESFTAANGWYVLEPAAESNSEGSGRPLTGFTLPEQETQEKYEGSENDKQITAIAAVGTLPAGQTMNFHITLRLHEDQGENNQLINYLSMGSHEV